MAGIDWSFIAQKGIEGESEHLTGYVPRKGSGFTVGSVDVGMHSGGKYGDLWTMLQSYANKQSPSGVGSINLPLYEKLNPYALRKDVLDEDGNKTGKQILLQTALNVLKEGKGNLYNYRNQFNTPAFLRSAAVK